jgi:hypothetical protein
MQNIQLSKLVPIKNSEDLIKEVKKVFAYHYPPDSFERISRHFLLIEDLFTGEFNGYKICNTQYHDLWHTLDTLLTAARILDGYNIKEEKIPIDISLNLFSACLMHDTGYIQEMGDDEGTGAKYTKIHVKRSNVFVKKNHDIFEISKKALKMINNFINCSGFQADMHSLPFSNNQEKVCGAILATADLLSQMADRTYLEKLLFLYYEFKEAGISGYNTEYDIIRNTINFYQNTKTRFKNELLSIYQYVQYHFKERFKIDKNLYIDAINKHIAYINKIMKDESTNFRHKLHRIKK